jgi:hypothetical protein
MAPREHTENEARSGKRRSLMSAADRADVAADDDVPRATQAARGEAEAGLTSPRIKAEEEERLGCL